MSTVLLVPGTALVGTKSRYRSFHGAAADSVPVREWAGGTAVDRCDWVSRTPGRPSRLTAGLWDVVVELAAARCDCERVAAVFIAAATAAGDDDDDDDDDDDVLCSTQHDSS